MFLQSLQVSDKYGEGRSVVSFALRKRDWLALAFRYSQEQLGKDSFDAVTCDLRQLSEELPAST